MQGKGAEAHQKERELKELGNALEGEKLKLEKLQESAGSMQQAAHDAGSMGGCGCSCPYVLSLACCG